MESKSKKSDAPERTPLIGALNRRQLGWLLMGLYVALLIATVALVLRFGQPQEPEVRKVGFVATGSFEEPGWFRTNYAGIQAACQTLDLELLVRDRVPEYTGECLKAVEELTEEGAEMIILSASGYSMEMEDHFAEYPEIAFFGLFANLGLSNLTGYSTRMYQARYLSGIIAGMQSESGKIGFVATSRTAEVCRGVSAFALGARRVRPDAEVIVYFAGATGDDRELQGARALIQREGVDVITHHEGQYSVIDAAEEAGICSIGYYEPVEGVSQRYLTCAMCDWQILYTELLREYLRGQTGEMVNNWLGLESGVVRLTAYSPLVSQAAIDQVEAARQELRDGYDVFTGEIYDNEGNLRCGPGEAISDETLTRNIDWLAEGVRIYGD